MSIKWKLFGDHNLKLSAPLNNMAIIVQKQQKYEEAEHKFKYIL